jgi:hypothetical protein
MLSQPSNNEVDDQNGVIWSEYLLSFAIKVIIRLPGSKALQSRLNDSKSGYDRPNALFGSQTYQ